MWQVDHLRLAWRRSDADDVSVREDRGAGQVGAEDAEVFAGLVEPGFLVAGGNREALHPRLVNPPHPWTRLRIQPAIREPEDARSAGDDLEHPRPAYVVALRGSCSMQQETAAGSLVAAVAEPDPLRCKIDDHECAAVHPNVYDFLVAVDHLSDMEPRPAGRARHLVIEVRVEHSIGRNRVAGDRKPLRVNAVVIPAAAVWVDRHLAARVLDESTLRLTCRANRDRQPASGRAWGSGWLTGQAARQCKHRQQPPPLGHARETVGR